MKRKVKKSIKAKRVLEALGFDYEFKGGFIYFTATKSELAVLHDLINSEESEI